MAIQVILQENYPSLGYVGDVVSVKPGYARNFLLPRGIAVDASSTNGRLLNHKMQGVQAKKAKLKAHAQEFGTKLQALTLSFTLKVGESGKTFGAITARDIETALKAQGHDINKKQVRLLEPFKAAGTYRVDIKIHSEVVVQVPVIVASEAPPAKAYTEDAAPRKRGGKKREEKPTESEETTAEAPSEVESE